MNHGSQLCKTDLHVHTPASLDYRDKKASAADIIAAAAAKDVDILAVTDHNSADFVDKMRAAAKGSGVTVVPGVEVTTPEGHILALFDGKIASTEITDFLIRVGIPRQEHGKEEAISARHAEDVIREIHKMGGVAIAAHANDKGIGLMQQKGQFKIRVVPMPELAALEFTKQSDIEKFSTGRVSPDYPPKACTQASDAHELAEIGQRVTYLKMQERSAYGITQALLDYEDRVRFPWNLPSTTHPRILRLKVDQGFFENEEFFFHENLNCLIGGQGAGKSTVVELLRYAFEDVSQFEHIYNDHCGKLDALLGHAGKVEVEYLDSDGQTKIVCRELQPWDTKREVRDGAGNLAEITAEPVLFSQGELVEIARSPMAQLELIDRRLDVEVQTAVEGTAIDKLRVNAGLLVAAINGIQRLSEELDHPENGLTATKVKHAELKSKLGDPILQEFPRWQAEQRLLATIKDAVTALEIEFAEAIDNIDLESVDLPVPGDAPNAKSLALLNDVMSRVQRGLKSSKADFGKAIKAILKDVDAASQTIRPAFTRQKAKHDGVLAAIGQTDMKKANARFQALGERLNSLEKKIGERSKLETKCDQLRKERGLIHARLGDARVQRSKKRQEKAAEYQAALSDVLKIEIAPLCDRSAFVEMLRELSRGGRILETDLVKVTKAANPSEVVAFVIAADSDGLSKRAGIGLDSAKRLIEATTAKGLNEVYKLETVALNDLPMISYFAEPGRLKPVHELSTGQKGTVIIALALIEGPGPLVVDHPEEPLDTRSVYGQVVSKLRDGKARRQFIFTTHNANIAVGADAELSHILGATADKGTIESRGAVDDLRTNELLLLHLEGGQVALDRRIKKYRKTAI